MEHLPKNILSSAISYASYREMVARLLDEGKTTGPVQSEAMLQYTRQNEQRMNRIEKTFTPEASVVAQLHNIERPMLWLVITEAWCGDASQIVPILQALAAENPNIHLQFILRDEHLDIMDAFLTNGGRSIPKVVFADLETLKIAGDWGPRPQVLQQMVLDNKAAMTRILDPEMRKVHYEKFQSALHLWYAKDRGQHIQTEFSEAAVAAFHKFSVFSENNI